MSDIRGLIIQSRLDFLENHTDETISQQVFQKLKEPLKQTIGEQVFLTNLYPFHLLKDLDAAIAESFDMPLKELFREIGAKTAPVMMDRYFFTYMQQNNPQGFLAQIERVYPYIWNFGKYKYSKISATEANTKFDYDEDIPKSYCWFIQSFLTNGVNLCGVKSVDIEEVECEAEDGEACRYKISWET
jgi:uncharacterized protein (TIGR02265 family)